MAADHGTLMFDPRSEDFSSDPYRHYADLRSRKPIFDQGQGTWVVSGFGEVRSILRSPHASAEDRYLGPGQMRDQAAAIAGDQGQPLTAKMMINTDPPDHARKRQIVAKIFTPRALTQLIPVVQAIVDRKLEAIVKSGGGEFMSQVATPVPFEVISVMLGIGESDGERARRAGEVIVQGLEPTLDPATAAAIREASLDLADMMASVIEKKRKIPGNDLLTELIRAEDTNGTLTTEELIAETASLYLAGHETTAGLIGNGLHALLSNPGQFELLKKNPTLVPQAIEEFMRYDSPVQMIRRVARSDFEVGGERVPAGAFMLLLLGAANRDEREFGPNASELEIDRSDTRHVAFGTGIHMCLGASLARLEASIVFKQIIERIPAIALDGTPIRNGNINLRGLKQLLVRLN